MEEEGVLSGDNAFNAHFGECIAAIGDIDDDGYQGQFQSKQLTLNVHLFACAGALDCITWSSSAGEVRSVVTVDVSELHYSEHI